MVTLVIQSLQLHKTKLHLDNRNFISCWKTGHVLLTLNYNAYKTVKYTLTMSFNWQVFYLFDFFWACAINLYCWKLLALFCNSALWSCDHPLSVNHELMAYRVRARGFLVTCWGPPHSTTICVRVNVNFKTCYPIF